MEKELIKLLLKKDFYSKNKSRLSKEFFTNGTEALYETIQHAHEDSDKDLSISEVSSLAPHSRIAVSGWFNAPEK